MNDERGQDEIDDAEEDKDGDVAQSVVTIGKGPSSVEVSCHGASDFEFQNNGTAKADGWKGKEKCGRKAEDANDVTPKRSTSGGNPFGTQTLPSINASCEIEGIVDQIAADLQEKRRRTTAEEWKERQGSTLIQSKSENNDARCERRHEGLPAHDVQERTYDLVASSALDAVNERNHLRFPILSA